MLFVVRLSWLLGLVLVIAGCATPALREAVPEKYVAAAMVPGMTDVRFWGDEAGGAVSRFLAQEGPRMRARYAGLPKSEVLRHHILALSGGADDGAFGAGLLVGWTVHGSRPTFNLVTGVSAGALIAPFAFLGPEYDAQLESMFKKYGGEDIYQTNVVSGLLGGTALADSAPLARLIARYVDAGLVARIAAARNEGRLLVIGTTNLDAQRPVYWDIGQIARSGRPDAIALIRKVLLASASIPGVFPPVSIPVVAGRHSYEEMHVDGGPTREVFLAPVDFSFRDLDRQIGRRVERSLWVIRNGKLAPEYAPVQATTLAISQRSVETLTKYQGLGDLARMYQNAKAQGLAFNLTSVPASFAAPRPHPFARDYMRALFDTGFELGRAGGGWTRIPPGIVVSER